MRSGGERCQAELAAEVRWEKLPEEEDTKAFGHCVSNRRVFADVWWPEDKKIHYNKESGGIRIRDVRRAAENLKPPKTH